jgi:hypothetical protein
MDDRIARPLIHLDVLYVQGEVSAHRALASGLAGLRLDEVVAGLAVALISTLRSTLLGEIRARAPDTARVTGAIVCGASLTPILSRGNLIALQA